MSGLMALLDDVAALAKLAAASVMMWQHRQSKQDQRPLAQ